MYLGFSFLFISLLERQQLYQIFLLFNEMICTVYSREKGPEIRLITRK